LSGIKIEKGKECTVCHDEPAGELIALGCGHFCCPDMWAGHLQSKIMGSISGDYKPGTTTITCPAEKCTQGLTKKDVLDILGQKAVENALSETKKLDATKQTADQLKQEYLELEKLSEETKYIECPAKNLDGSRACKGRIKRASSGKVKCDTCNKSYCFDCSNQHEGTNSKDCFKARRANLAAAKTIKKALFSKNCPKCSFSIEKAGGCAQMTCPSPTCGFKFCWACLRERERKDRTGCTSAYRCIGTTLCPVCRKPVADVTINEVSGQAEDIHWHNDTFKIHGAQHDFGEHRMHPGCLLKLLGHDPKEGLPYIPETLFRELLIPFYDQTRTNQCVVYANKKAEKYPCQTKPGMFPCPICGYWVEISLSPDRKSLQFQEIDVEEVNTAGKVDKKESGIYAFKGTIGGKNLLPLAKPAPELIDIDFSADSSTFENALKAIASPEAQTMYRAFYNQLNNKSQPPTVPLHIKELAEMYLPSETAKLLTNKKTLATYVQLLVEDTVIMGNREIFFVDLVTHPTKKLQEKELQKFLEYATTQKHPWWHLAGPFTQNILMNSLLPQLPENDQVNALLVTISDIMDNFQKERKLRDLEKNCKKALADFSNSLQSLKARLPHR
jgi:hypothetical protein